MTSIFNLKTDVKELSSINQGIARMEYDQKQPTRDITGTNFPNGAIRIRWQTGGQRWWVPSRSYIRMRCRLTRGDGATRTPLTTEDNIAPAMNLASNLFQSLEFRINDKVVSRVSDFVSQVDAIETRLTKSKSWLDSVGKSSNWWESDFKVRQHQVCSDGITKQEAETLVGRVAALGLDAGTNTIAYDAGTGVWTFAAGGGAAIPDLTTRVNVGDYLTFTSASGQSGVLNVPMRVLAVAAATITTEGKGADVASALGANNLNLTRSVLASRVSEFEITWTPPLSIFKVGHALPQGRYELVLNPHSQSQYQTRAIESRGATKTPFLQGGGNTDFNFSVENMFLYVNTVEGPRADNITYLLDLEQTRCQADSIDNVSFQPKNFDVSPSSYALSVAYQDVRSGTDTRVSPSVLRSYDAATSSVSQELSLNRFFINYAGQSLPTPDADPSFIAGRDYTTQRYTETQIYNGAYFDSGGAEDIKEFQDRGAYYYFSWPRDGTDASTRVNVHQSFESGTDVANLRLLLFDHSKQVARVSVQDGRVVAVDLEDA